MPPYNRYICKANVTIALGYTPLDLLHYTTLSLKTNNKSLCLA